MSDLLQFAQDSHSDSVDNVNQKYWTILIVDDEKDIHNLTVMVMDNFSFMNRNLRFLHAYSAKEAKEILHNEKEIAVILLDVVMETTTAGLDLVKYIRKEINNTIVRIILRTGQPGSAPEKDVIFDYDINDYKYKTELTKSKLDTAIISAIRAYNDLSVLKRSRRGLRKIIEASSNIFEVSSIKQFIEGLLIQLTSLLKLDDDSLFLETSAVAVESKERIFSIVAATGKYALSGNIPDDISKLANRSIKDKQSYFENQYYVGYFPSQYSHPKILILDGAKELEEADRYLIELFSKNINLAFENHYRHQARVETRDDILYTLGEITEHHKAGNSKHVRRVGEIAYLLAELMGLSIEEAEEIKIACAMHDVGKLFLDESILEKETPLTDMEKEVMRLHTVKGNAILKEKNIHLLKNAAIVAYEHHERWDGTGYPEQLKEEQIHPTARIANLALIYDALCHDQPYRKAWTEKETLKFIKDNSGKIFDPQLVDLFLENYSQIKKITKMYQD